jgi:hypothetical protein
MEQATQTARIIIPSEFIPKRGSGSPEGNQKVELQEAEWHGVGILYARKVDSGVELRLLYESHISEHIKDEIAKRFGIGAIAWQVT